MSDLRFDTPDYEAYYNALKAPESRAILDRAEAEFRERRRKLFQEMAEDARKRQPIEMSEEEIQMEQLQASIRQLSVEEQERLYHWLSRELHDRSHAIGMPDITAEEIRESFKNALNKAIDDL